MNLNFEILYANQSCAEWVGIPQEKLIGLRCVYSSTELNNHLKNRIRGLCPPPSLLTGQSANATISRQHEKETHYRSAFFTRLDDRLPESKQVILAIADSSNLLDLDSQNGLASKKLHDTLAALSDELNAAHTMTHLVGQSSAAIRMRRQAQIAIECQADLLIEGPTGTGKAHLAQIIFNERRKSEDQLVTLEGALVDRAILQKKIKNWVYDQQGSAGRDWLLILNIDQLSPAAQEELYGFTQLPNFRLRIIATSSHSLLELAASGRFLSKLAFYLTTMVLQTTALSERIADLPLLVQAFIEERNAQATKQIGGCSKEALEMLAQCRWHRNIDQLKEAVFLAWDNATATTLQSHDFPEEVQQLGRATQFESRTDVQIELESYLESIEQRLIARALHRAKGNKSKAAKLLGLNRAKLLRRLNHFNLEERTGLKGDHVVDSSAFLESDKDDEAQS
ncbi:MAG: sigma 54-interacting transcriptional regulator [Mariniblastus sp.]|nr:sigma 54-interacting transcriptional regulator [Mariniblastus sp.]